MKTTWRLTGTKSDLERFHLRPVGRTNRGDSYSRLLTQDEVVSIDARLKDRTWETEDDHLSSACRLRILDVA